MAGINAGGATATSKPVRKAEPSSKTSPEQKATPQTANPLTAALAGFGIDYPNAPKPSAALLAFVNGLGMTLGTAEDAKDLGIAQIQRRTADYTADLERTSAKSKRNLTAGLVQRGVHSSGEANTRYADQAAKKASQQAAIARGDSEGVTAVQNAYDSVVGGTRTSALDKVLNEETSQSLRTATSEAQEEAWRRQEEADAARDEKVLAAQRASDARWEKFYRTGSF